MLYEEYKFTEIPETQNPLPYGQDTAANRSASRTASRRRKKKNRLAKRLAACVAFAAVFGTVSGGISVGITHLSSNNDRLVTSYSAQLSEETEAAGPSALPGSMKTGLEDGTEDAQTPTLFTEKGRPDSDAESTANTLKSDGSASLTTEEVAELGLSSVVAITNKSVQEVQNYFGSYYGFPFAFGGNGSGGGTPQTYEATSMGTGILIEQDDDTLYIATNAHVVENASTLSVAFVDDSAASAEIVGYDADNDLAVISVSLSDLSDATKDAISLIAIGSSDSLKLGEQVVAIGNALGYGQSVSEGIVSALNRTMEGGEGIYGEGLIQTDAAINPGNSGGALLNMRGELIGINSAKYASTKVEGMGYAIPVSAAWPILTQMIHGTAGAI